MSIHGRLKVGYVVKRYPRFSETFIVNEILAHERAGWIPHLFSLLPPNDTHFQESISQVRAPVIYLPAEKPKGSDLWRMIRDALQQFPRAKEVLANAVSTTAQEIHQAISLALSIRKSRVDHLHAHFATSAATVARLASQIAGIPYSLTAHAKDIFHTEVDDTSLREKIAGSSAIVTVSDYNADHLRARFPECSSKVVRIYNGLHLPEFPFEASQDREQRIVAVGRLVEKKGFLHLLEALAMLVKQGVCVDCEILGDGPQRNRLETQLAKLELGDHIRLLGAVPQRLVYDKIRRAALLAAPCVTAADGDRDGLPTVVLEAMAMGTLCVGTDVTGLPEVLRDRETGLVAPPGNASVLAAKIADAMNSMETRRRIAINARALIEQAFDVDRNAAQLRAVFPRAESVVPPALVGAS